MYKRKRNESKCDNYQGISLLAVAGKIFAKVLLSRLQLLANYITPESQCGFRASRSIIDMVLSLTQLQEKAIEQHKELHAVFVDVTKAFDSVDRNML